jgi:hypothetical protein
MADEDPDLAAFRAKLKQGGGMSRADRDTWQRARPMVIGFLLAAVAIGAVKVKEHRDKTEKDAADTALKAKDDAEREARVREEMAREAAFDAKFASIAAAVEALDPGPLERAAPSLVAGRKVLGLQAKSTAVFERDAQGSGGAFAGSPAEVGIVVTMSFDILKDRPVRYEGGAVLAPTRKTFSAIAWPEKKVVATWTEVWTPPTTIRVMRIGKQEMPMEYGPSSTRWKTDAEQLAAGIAPKSMNE